MGQPHCMAADAGRKETGNEAQVESVQPHDRRAHPAQFVYQPV